MPFHWENNEEAPDRAGAFSHREGDAPRARLTLWPHRSLPRKGFAAFIGALFVMILVPVLPLLGTPVMWGLLPFTMLAVWGMYAALMRSYRDGETREELTLWSDHLSLVRSDPNRAPRHFEANPFWVRVDLREDRGPVPFYLTLSGAGREVELGAFLSAEERQSLYEDLNRMIRP